MSTASIKFYLNKSKKSKKGNKTPIYMRITKNRQKVEYRLPISLNERDINQWDEMQERFIGAQLPNNRFIDKYKSEFNDIAYLTCTKINSLSAKEILNKITGKAKVEVEISVLQYFTNRYEQFVFKDKEKSIGTKKNYKKALLHFSRYLNASGFMDIKFTEIKKGLGTNFKEYLTSENPEMKKGSMTEVSASGNIKKIKTFFQDAIREGLTDKNPFDGLKLKTRSPKKEKLSSQQVKAIFHEPWGNLALEEIADIFMFSVYTALAYSDAQKLKKEELQYWKDGNVYLNTYRQKSKEKVRIFLVKPAIDIITKYKGYAKNGNSGYILPRISNKTYNQYLKIIAVRVGVNFNLTTHTARHTFRLLQNEAKSTDIATIKTMMGQSAKNDIDYVYNDVSERQLLDAKELLEKYLINLL